MTDEHLAAIARDAFDIEQGFVPGKDSLSRVRNISETFLKNRVVSPGNRCTDGTPYCQQS